MPGFVGLPEMILFGIIALVIFGPKRLPEMGRSLGKGLREFKSSVSGEDKDKDVEAMGDLDIARMQDDAEGDETLEDTTVHPSGRTPAVAG